MDSENKEDDLDTFLEEGFPSLLKELPEPPHRRKSFLEIIGRSEKELVNSKFLSFYLDPEKEHGFGCAFLKGLVKAYNAKQENASNEFRKIPLGENGEGWNILDDRILIQTEVSVPGSQERIDILISGFSQGEEDENSKDKDEKNTSTETPDWLIIVENKLHARLGVQQLKNYWDKWDKQVEASKMRGILLSLEEYGPEEVETNAGGAGRYLNVTHGDLIEQVKQHLSSTFDSNADDRHMLLVKDYFLNMENLSNMEADHDRLNEILRRFHKKGSEIQKIKELDRELLEWVNRVADTVMKDFGFEPASENSKKKGEHYYPSQDNVLNSENFRFYIWLDDLRYSQDLWAVLELYDENACYGSWTKELLKNKWEISPKEGGKVTFGTGGKDDAQYHHIYEVNIELPPLEGKDFEEVLREALREHFFETSSKFLENAQAAFDRAKSDKEGSGSS